MLRAWYDDRPEVERWQKDTIAAARSVGLYYYADGSTSTVAGPAGTESGVAGQRCAGGDQYADSGLRGGRRHDGHACYWRFFCTQEELGYTLLLQIHDEVILEGPSENADAALASW